MKHSGKEAFKQKVDGWPEMPKPKDLFTFLMFRLDKNAPSRLPIKMFLTNCDLVERQIPQEYISSLDEKVAPSDISVQDNMAAQETIPLFGEKEKVHRYDNNGGEIELRNAFVSRAGSPILESVPSALIFISDISDQCKKSMREINKVFIIQITDNILNSPDEIRNENETDFNYYHDFEKKINSHFYFKNKEEYKYNSHLFFNYFEVELLEHIGPKLIKITNRTPELEVIAKHGEVYYLIKNKVEAHPGDTLYPKKVEWSINKEDWKPCKQEDNIFICHGENEASENILSEKQIKQFTDQNPVLHYNFYYGHKIKISKDNQNPALKKDFEFFCCVENYLEELETIISLEGWYHILQPSLKWWDPRRAFRGGLYLTGLSTIDGKVEKIKKEILQKESSSEQYQDQALTAKQLEDDSRKRITSLVAEEKDKDIVAFWIWSLIVVSVVVLLYRLWRQIIITKESKYTNIEMSGSNTTIEEINYCNRIQYIGRFTLEGKGKEHVKPTSGLIELIVKKDDGPAEIENSSL